MMCYCDQPSTPHSREPNTLMGVFHYKPLRSRGVAAGCRVYINSTLGGITRECTEDMDLSSASASASCRRWQSEMSPCSQHYQLLMVYDVERGYYSGGNLSAGVNWGWKWGWEKKSINQHLLNILWRNLQGSNILTLFDGAVSHTSSVPVPGPSTLAEPNPI